MAKFNLIAQLEAQLETKRQVVSGALAEVSRLEVRIADTNEEIRQIEDALLALRARSHKET